jgi:hypothetical protein
MKKLLSMLLAAGLLVVQFSTHVQAARSSGATPPVAQPLVREGDFATGLAETLGLATDVTEAQAEDMLTAAGIAPRNGWVADYPVTPDIIGELQDAVAAAADGGRLKMARAEAVTAVQTLTDDYGLPVIPDERAVTGEATYGQNTGPPQSSEYPDSSVVDNYYYDEGPPVVTYYSPPWDYNYLYSWVPYPFWWGGFGFSGFFVLNDFHVYSNFHHGRFAHHKGFHHNRFHNRGFHHNDRGLISNHVVNHSTNRVSVINPAQRATGSNALVSNRATAGRGFTSQAAKNGATSIMARGQQRAVTSNSNVTAGRSSGLVGRGIPQMANRSGANRTGNAVGALQPRGTNSGSVNALRSFDGRGRMGAQRSFAGNSRFSNNAARGGGNAFRSGRAGIGDGGGFSRGSSFARGGGGFSGGRGLAMHSGGFGGGSGFRGGSGGFGGGGGGFRGGGGGRR